MLAGDLAYHADPIPVQPIDLVPTTANTIDMLTAKQNGSAPIDLGANTFTFYGQTYTGPNSLFVNLKGLITFDGPNTNDVNDPMGDHVPEAALAPLWDDWSTWTNDQSKVLYTIEGNQLIIEWNMVESFAGSTTPITFQAVLELNTVSRPGAITFNYPNLDTGDFDAEGASATVGIKSAGGADASRLVVSYSAAETGTNTASPLVHSGRALLISTNQAPTFNRPDPNSDLVGFFQVNEGSTATLTASATDPDGDTLTYAWDLDFDGVYETVGQTVSFDLGTLGGPFGLLVPVQVSDGHGHDVTAFVALDILNVPPSAADRTLLASEDTPADINLLDPAFVSDPGPDNLSVFFTQPGHVIVTPGANGAVTYTPNANYFGADSFTYVVTDGDPQGVSRTATVAITVAPVNDAPLGVDDAYTTAEDTTLDVPAADLLVNDFDVDGDALSAVLVSGPSHGSLALNADGSFKYTPALNYNGPDGFTYRTSDGVAQSGVVSVALTVTPVNDAPTAAGDSYTVDEDGTLTVPAPGVLGNDSDVDGDALAAVLVSGASHGTLAVNADGSFQYTPNANYNGSDSFTYLASDGQGGASAPATVAITVTAVNDAPTAAADEAVVNEDGSVAGNVLVNDTDVDGAAPTKAVLVDGPTRGNVTLNADGSFLYVPLPNFFGIDHFTYVARDAADAASAVTDVKVTVNEVNDAPVVSGEAIDTAHDTSVTGNVLVNDTDKDNDDGYAGNEDTLTATLLSGPSSGTLVLGSDGRFTYTPNAGFTGTDSFRYQVSDGRGGVGQGVATITVAAGEPAPEPEGTVQLVDDVTQPGKTALVINGTARGELIAVVHATDGVEVYFGCASVGVFNPTGRILVHANGGNDLVYVGPGVLQAAWLYGDDGNDIVKLGHGGGIAFGGAGNDLVSGGNGRDILVGGEGSDLLVGNPGDDILISALTTYDDRAANAAHEDAWAHLYAEWNSARTFGERVNNLRDGTGPAGRLNGSYFLNDATINDDAALDAIDVLSGSAGSDWFIYKFGEDAVIGMTKTEAQYDLGIS
jgi:VCBS repeat-containing protein